MGSSEADNETGPMNSDDSPASVDNKTVEERYQKKMQLEHILLRPDTYSKFNREAFLVVIVGRIENRNWYSRDVFPTYSRNH